MSFVSDLRNHLINDEQVDDLSGNERFSDFNFIGLKETTLALELVSFTKADGLTEEQISELCDKFFNITRIVSYDDFGLNPGPRNPNGLLCFVFEDDCPNSLLDFIKRQTRIAHWGRSAVIVSWVIDVKNKQIHIHNNPVSIFPPVVIMEWLTFPNLKYLKLFLNSYRPQSTHINNNVEVVIQSFKRLEERVEEVYKLFKSMPRHKYENYFPDTKIVTLIYGSDMYIRNSESGKLIMNNTGDTYNVGQAGAVGRNARSDNNTFFQSEQKQTLAEAAAEIQKLLKQLEHTNPSATEVEKIAYVDDETTPSFKRRVVSALQAGGETAIDEFILENKYLKVAKAAIKGWLQPDS